MSNSPLNTKARNFIPADAQVRTLRRIGRGIIDERRNMKYAFEEIKRSQKITKICQVCGKKRTRTITESMTINPFNKDKNGNVRTKNEVYDAVDDKLQESLLIMAKNFICKSCQDELPWPHIWPRK